MSETPTRSVARAEPVGSLIRPREITDLLEAIYADSVCASPQFVLPGGAAQLGELQRLADNGVAELVRRQQEAGMDVVTDGEIRRSTFLSSFWDAVEGLSEPPERLKMRDAAGEVVYEGFADPTINGRVRKAGSPAVGEIAVLRSVDADVPFKVTFPAPSYFYCDIVEMDPGSAYQDRHAFVEEAVEVERQLVVEAVAAGARWIQFDFPLYPALADGEYGARLAAALGESVEGLLGKAIEADRRVTADLPDDVTVGMHICRGNIEGGFWNGSLEPVAERMFNELPHQRFLIEWEDTGREGDYAPLRFVPEGKLVALGLVSTKTPELEAEDDIVRRLEQAGEHLAMHQLGICPQCGFASLFGDRLVAREDAQWRKLELVGQVADRVWGR